MCKKKCFIEPAWKYFSSWTIKMEDHFSKGKTVYLRNIRKLDEWFVNWRAGRINTPCFSFASNCLKFCMWHRTEHKNLTLDISPLFGVSFSRNTICAKTVSCTSFQNKKQNKPFCFLNVWNQQAGALVNKFAHNAICNEAVGLKPQPFNIANYFKYFKGLWHYLWLNQIISI